VPMTENCCTGSALTAKTGIKGSGESGEHGATVQLQWNRTARIVFVTNICPHYRVKTFETLAQYYYNVEFFFYSAGNEWYWQQNHRVRTGNFRHTYLPALQLSRRRVRLVPSLVSKLWLGNFDVYIKCINGRFALPTSYIIARLRRRPFVLWTGIWMKLDTPFHRLVFPLTRWIYRHADAIVVYGEHVKRYLMSLKIEPEKIFVAAHAVDNDKYRRSVPENEKANLRAKLNIANERIVMYLGRLEEVKGIEYLLRAFASLKVDHTTLMVVGEGSLKMRLVELAQELGIADKTRFVGYASPEEATNYYALADVLVLPSVTTPQGKETWGLVVNEAMNQGVPVVATDAVGAAAGGLVQPGVNGFIVPERDANGLAEAMARILTDAKLREHLSANARRIVAGWDNERMVKGFREAIDYAMGLSHCRKHRMPNVPSKASLPE
jgi:glycosyltransferase involved in cell wall biosynthesis